MENPIYRIMMHGFPGRTWRYTAEEGLVMTDGLPEPSEEELAAADASLSAIAYQNKRKKEFPTTDELIVALWEKLVENRDVSAEAVQARREAIKLKYPKP